MSEFAVRCASELRQVAKDICEQIDWELPELVSSTARQAFSSGDCLTAALEFVAHLRRRETPKLGFTHAWITRLRSSRMEHAVRAREQWESALAENFLFPYHNNAFAALGSETLQIAATVDLCDRTAECILGNRRRWEEGFWGVTHSICELLRFLWPLKECSDASLLPAFGWLLKKSAAEWSRARCWDESTLGTSGHNWWAHTFLGFWMFGTFFPEFRHSRQFKALGTDYLQRELNLLFENDGWSKEGSPGYHEVAVTHLLRFAHLFELNGGILPEKSRNRLRAIADAGWKLLMPDGEYPLFGDYVRGGIYAFFSDQKRLDYSACNVTRRRAALFSLPEAKYVADSLDASWRFQHGNFLQDEGRDLLQLYDDLPATSPATTDMALTDSGCYVIRQDWTPNADCAVISAGVLGPRITSHKHADIFGMELYSRGRRILVDNGYGPVAEERTDRQQRMWRVGSSAHNVATVDGEDIVPIPAEFWFGATVIPTVDDWRSEPAFAYFSGAHEGYIRLADKVTAVRRKLFYLRGLYWILIDRFTAAGQGSHEYQLHFHINAPATLHAGGRLSTQGKGGNLLIFPVPDASGHPVLSPSPHPVQGYENPQHLCYTRESKGNTLFVTLLFPFENDNCPDVEASLAEVECDGRVLDPWEGTGLQIIYNGEEHFYFDQHMQWNLPWKSGKYSGQGRLFHSSCRSHT